MKTSNKRLIIFMVVLAMMAGFLFLGCSAQEDAVENDAPVETGGSSDGKLTSWTPDMDCTICHTAENSSLSDATTTAGGHVDKGVNCSTCHSDVASLEDAHEGVPMGEVTLKRLKKTEVDPETCTASSCHSDENDLIQAIAGTVVLTDANGREANPHDLPAVEGHAEISCLNCHYGHKPLALESVKDGCVSCHHTNEFIACSTCHDH